MNNYAILRFAKVKKTGLAAIYRHQHNRDKLKTRTHPENEKYNVNKTINGKTFNEIVDERIIQQEKDTGRKIRKDTVCMIETVCTYSPEMENKIPFKAFCKECINYIKKEFPTAILAGYSTNLDEKTRHIHIYWLPTNKDKHFCCAKVLGNKKDFIKHQDNFAEQMKQFGLKRGISKEITKAKHKNSKKWWAEQRITEKEINDILR